MILVELHYQGIIYHGMNGLLKDVKTSIFTKPMLKKDKRGFLLGGNNKMQILALQEKLTENVDVRAIKMKQSFKCFFEGIDNRKRVFEGEEGDYLVRRLDNGMEYPVIGCIFKRFYKIIG